MTVLQAVKLRQPALNRGMKIFELLSQSTQQQLDQAGKQQSQQVPGLNPDSSAQAEDDGQGKFDADKVDGSLQDIAQSVQDKDAQPDVPSGGEAQDPALDNSNVKPIDSALLSQIKNLSFSTKYDFKDNSPINPLNIAAMSLADLSNLNNMVRWKMQLKTVQDRVGLDDDIDMQFYTDLIKFTNTVMKFKKTNTSSQLAGIKPAPSYQTMKKPQQSPANDNAPQMGNAANFAAPLSTGTARPRKKA